MSERDKVIVSMGCPAGIGPEVLLKGIWEVYQKFFKDIFERVIVVGDEKVLRERARLLGIPYPEELKVISVSNLKVVPGEPTEASDKAMAEYVKVSIKLLKEGKAGALVTCPITKEGISRAGIPYKGHTDWLASEFGVKDYVMCFYGEKMIVSLVTTHIPLKEVPARLNFDNITSVIKISWDFLKRLKRQDKGIAVCGLNPHAGEGGLLGKEEIEFIKEAVSHAQKQGIKVKGPFPPDTIFYWAYKGRYDLVVSLYHDQGLAPFKLVHFEDGVNITLGLPIIRTSPCHGTAYDIAKKGIANPQSFVSALKLALRLL